MEVIKNKTKLLELKEELKIIKSGKDILQQKRDILLKEILKILEDVDILRNELNEKVQKSYNLLIKAYMEAGRDNVIKEAQISIFKGKLDVYPKSFMGIPVPEVKFKIEPVKFPLSPISESIFIELARNSFLECIKIILKLADIEIKAWKLSEELKKTTIRVNALEKYYIPMYQKNIKEIQNTLEEAEREFLILLKKIGDK